MYIKLEKISHDEYFKQMESMFGIKLYWYQKFILKMMLFKNEKRILPVKKMRGLRQSLIAVDEHCNMNNEEIARILEPFESYKPFPTDKKVLFNLKN